MRRRFAVSAGAVACGAMVLAGVVVPPGASAAGPRPADRTSRTEARRIAAVKSPTIRWKDCSALVDRGQCGSLRVPLDYDRPNGPWIDIALFKVKAAKPSQRQGTLFLNPGGPGGSGVAIAAAASRFLSPALLDRFDVVGFDPRGTNLSTNVRCWKDANAQARTFALAPAVPVTATEQQRMAAFARQVGRACSTGGRPMSASMSTAEVARDLEVMRRAVGDEKLTYLGFSYGTYLGAAYANLFPDRAGRLVVDGVLDPVAWAGTRKTRDVPLENRILSAKAQSRALQQFFARCVKAGRPTCAMLEHGDPARNFTTMVAALRSGRSISWKDPASGLTLAVDLEAVLATIDSVLRGTVVDVLDSYLADIYGALAAPASSTARAGYLRQAVRLQDAVRTMSGAGSTALRRQLADRFGVNWPYANSLDAYQSVLCTDGLHGRKATDWIAWARRTEARYPLFGSQVVWSSAPCARTTWTAHDEDAYRGPFTKRTGTPVLVVGNYWDPATAYEGARGLARRLGNARLLTSDNWGHTAYGTSDCVTKAIDTYLLTGRTPKAGTVCHSDLQPFTASAAPLGTTGSRSTSPSPDAALADRRTALESALRGPGARR